ncbi:MAG TPA: nuclear transport factor 2 family protein [Mycobacteriales bacterium]|nr:nuclear transport factor 2 family protein [Mycobacteriales bacterium]
MNSTEISAVTAANAELYAAFEAGDIDRMSVVWDPDDDVVCVHPGWPPVSGRGRVLRSWSVIMANTVYIQFFLTGIVARVEGDVAVVTCEENILTGVADDAGGLAESARACATNVFRRRGSEWRLWVHHASPVIAPSGPSFS